MQRLNPVIKRTVSDADREATLKALGINLRLPLTAHLTEPLNAVPIPRVIHSVWVGGEIPLTRRAGILASLEITPSRRASVPIPTK